MYCWNCGTILSDLSCGKISFRALCDKCGASLHCCQNCKYYKPGLPNNCAIPGTEYVADRQANNFCDEFVVLDKVIKKQEVSAKKRFEDLFKDV